MPSYSTSDIVRGYSAFAGLAGDERWRKLTARTLLTHSGRISNFHFMEPDQKLRIHFEPGSLYAYSGDGLILLQFVLEQGLGIDVGTEMNRRLFAPNGMTRTSLIWRPDFRLQGHQHGRHGSACGQPCARRGGLSSAGGRHLGRDPGALGLEVGRHEVLGGLTLRLETLSAGRARVIAKKQELRSQLTPPIGATHEPAPFCHSFTRRHPF